MITKFCKAPIQRQDQNAQVVQSILMKAMIGRTTHCSIQHFKNIRFSFSAHQEKEQQHAQPDSKFIYSDPQIYFLKRNFPKLQRLVKQSYLIAGINFTMAGALYFYSSWGLMFPILVSFMSVPFALRARVVQHNLRHSVSVIELSQDKEHVEITYGANLSRIWSKVRINILLETNHQVEDLRLIKIQDMKNPKLKESGGFIAVVEAKKSLDKQSTQKSSLQSEQNSIVSGLQVYVDGSGKSGACDVQNIDLLVSVLKGDLEKVKQYKLVLDEESEYSKGKGV